MSNCRLIVDQLSNNEAADDQEMIDFLSKETGIEQNTVSKIVQEQRTYFMRECLTMVKAEEIISEYL